MSFLYNLNLDKIPVLLLVLPTTFNLLVFLEVYYDSINCRLGSKYLQQFLLVNILPSEKYNV